MMKKVNCVKCNIEIVYGTFCTSPDGSEILYYCNDCWEQDSEMVEAYLSSTDSETIISDWPTSNPETVDCADCGITVGVYYTWNNKVVCTACYAALEGIRLGNSKCCLCDTPTTISTGGYFYCEKHLNVRCQAVLPYPHACYEDACINVEGNFYCEKHGSDNLPLLVDKYNEGSGSALVKQIDVKISGMDNDTENTTVIRSIVMNWQGTLVTLVLEAYIADTVYHGGIVTVKFGDSSQEYDQSFGACQKFYGDAVQRYMDMGAKVVMVN